MTRGEKIAELTRCIEESRLNQKLFEDMLAQAQKTIRTIDGVFSMMDDIDSIKPQKRADATNIT